MKYYVTLHRDEDQKSMVGEMLDPCNSHMVLDTGYDLESMRSIASCHPWKIVWEMERCAEAKFGWKFKTPIGIPA